MSRLRVVARVICLADHISEMQTTLLQLVAATRQEPGCISYELLQNQADPTEFTFLEEWKSAEALEAHFATEHMQIAMAKLPTLAAQEPDIRQYLQLI